MTNNLTPKESLGVRLRRILRDQDNVRMKANEEEWVADQNDHNNWFTIPDLGIDCSEANRSQFSDPIVHPDLPPLSRSTMTSIRELVRVARKLVLRDFSSMDEVLNAYVDISGDPLSTDSKHVVDTESLTERHAVAWAYLDVVQSLRDASVNYVTNKDRCIRSLATAAETLADWMSGDARRALRKAKLAGRKGGRPIGTTDAINDLVKRAFRDERRSGKKMKQILANWRTSPPTGLDVTPTNDGWRFEDTSTGQFKGIKEPALKKLFREQKRG